MNQKSQTQIGRKIGHLRQLKRITREKMADDLKMSLSGYSKIERDEIEITIERAKQIVEILGITLIELIIFDENNIFGRSTLTQTSSINFPDIRDKDGQKELITLLKTQLEEKDNLILFLLKKSNLPL